MRKPLPVIERINPSLKHRSIIVTHVEKGDTQGAKAALEALSTAIQAGYRDKFNHLSVALEYVLEKDGEKALMEIWRSNVEAMDVAERYREMGNDRDQLVGEPISTLMKHKQKIIDAIDKKESAEVKKLLDSFTEIMESGYKDKLEHLGIALEYVLRKNGEEGVAEIWRRSFGPKGINYGGMMDRMGKDPEQLIAAQERLKGGLVSACSDATYTVTETDDFISYDYTACHSGGPFRRGDLNRKDWMTMEGKDWKPMFGDSIVGESKVYPYCIHCGVLNEIYKEKGALLEFKYGKDPENGDPCSFIIHKPKGWKPAKPRAPWYGSER